MGNIAAAHWGHDSAICFYKADTQTFHTVEMEKLSGIKHFRGHGRHDQTVYWLKKVLKVVEEEFGIENDFDTFIIGSDWQYLDADTWAENDQLDSGLKIHPKHVKEVFNVKEFKVAYRHHAGHAWCGIAQSQWANEKCAVFTHDAGGDDGHTFLWKYSPTNNVLVSKQTPQWQEPHHRTFFGRYYTASSCHGVHAIASKTEQSLDIAGKVMGAAAYGDKRSPWYIVGQRLYKEDPETVEWINPMARYFKSVYLQTKEDLEAKGIRGYKSGKEYLNKVFAESPECFNPYESWTSPIGLTWEEQTDVALGIQTQHEREVLNFLKKHREFIRQCNDRLIVSGGCALNVLVNKRIQEELGLQVFVPPNVHDCGLPFGFLVQHLVEIGVDTWKGVDITYSGSRLHDRHELDTYKERYHHEEITISDLAKILKNDDIIGFIQGGGEVGARALGNRSIICDPKGYDKKDKVNIVKKREPYRPFAPMCRREDAQKYFEAGDYDNLAYMNFAVMTRPEYTEQLAAVTHADGTARLQTVTREQNKFIHDLLTEFDGVLLNTSFNVQGKPILNTLEEAFTVLDRTALDGVAYLDDDEKLWLFTSKKA